MQQEGVLPNSGTFGGLLNVCASMVALEEGRYANEQVIQSGWDSDVFVKNCLVDMYAKRGSIEDAWRVSNKLSSCYVVSWNAILGGCAMHGHVKLLYVWNGCVTKVYNQMMSLLFIFCQLVAMQVWGPMHTLLCFNDPCLHGFCEIGTWHLYGQCSWLCWPSKGGREHDQRDTTWKALLSACRILGNLEMGKHDAK
jgi:pentatricopeptide repeat protein